MFASWRRVSSTLAAVAVMSAGAPPAPALADPFDPVHQLSATGSVYLVNDEPFWQADDKGTHDLDRKIIEQPWTEAVEWYPCQGGEVRAWVRVTAEHLGNGTLKVKVGMLLEEGRKCRRDLFDSGDLAEAVVTLKPNTSRNITMTARNSSDVASHDRADLTLRLYNRCTILLMNRCTG